MIAQIIRREFTTLLRNRAMIVSTVVILLLILVAGGIGRFVLADDDKGDADATPIVPVIGVEEQMSGYADYLEMPDGPDIDVEIIGEGEGRTFLETLAERDSGTPAAVLAGAPGAPVAMLGTDGFAGPNQQLTTIVNAAATTWYVEQLGEPLSDNEYLALQDHVNVDVQTVTTGTANLIMTNPVGYISSFVGVFLMFMMIIMGITTIANGVVEEKSSRVVEIVLTTIRPRTLLLGKVLGIGTFVFVQFLLFVLAAIVALNIAGLWMDLDLSAFFGWMLVWLVLGFFFYATVAGALASTATRQEDLSAVTTPVTMALLIPLYTGLFLVPSQPDALITKIISQIPGFSPFLMPVRQAYDTVTTMELFIAAGLGVIAIPAVAAVAGKIYENSILHTGKRLKVRDALRGK